MIECDASHALTFLGEKGKCPGKKGDKDSTPSGPTTDRPPCTSQSSTPSKLPNWAAELGLDLNIWPCGHSSHCFKTQLSRELTRMRV